MILSIKPKAGSAPDVAGSLRLDLPLQPELVRHVKRLATSSKTSTFAVCVAVFKLLLMRWSGQDDVIIGASLHQRDPSKPGSDTRGSTGRLVILPLRTDVSGDPAFSEVLSRIHQGIVNARHHGDLAFDAFAAPPEVSHTAWTNPLFVAIVHEASNGTARDHEGSSAALELHVGPPAAGLHCTIQGRANACEEAALHALAEQYVHLLRQIVERPDAAVSDHCLAVVSPRVQLPDATLPLKQTPLPDVASQFHDQARRTPDAAALQFGTRIWTYRELDASCLALAVRLRNAGTRAATVVALQGARSPALVAAMTATTMCGGVFVVLDPDLPKARRERMLGDAGATVLCHIAYDSANALDLALGPACALLRIDPELADVAPLGDLSNTFEPVRAQPDDAICVVFTSGSTGHPKPVLASHKGLAHLVQWHATKFAVAAQDSVALLSSLSFGMMLRDVYVPLTTGATLCIPEDADFRDPLAWCGRQGITIIHTTPTVLDTWLRLGAGRALPLKIRWVFAAGEPLTDVVVRAWRSRFPSSSGIVNLYGSTEASFTKCFYVVPEKVEPGLQPVGLSLPDTQALVFGPTGVPCGIGERGEIAIRTPYLSLGYLGLDDETRRKFRPNAQRNDPRDLLYFTGDVGRYRADGMLELAGRLDDQVKIRGVRIEPAEVTATLADLPGVAQCIVLARRTHNEAPAELIAYVVAEAGSHLATATMRQHLGARLPAAMVPRAFVVMDRLPRLPNGKLDRSRLPVPEATAAEVAERMAPSTPVEEMVWALWSEALNQRDFGVRDNFFDLGGHSLLAMQVISRLCEKLGVDLTTRSIFDAPTVAELAEIAQHKMLRAVAGSHLPIARLSSSARTGLLPPSAAQLRMYFWHEFARGSALYNVPVVLSLHGCVDPAALQSSLRALMQRHDLLCSRWVVTGSVPMLAFDAGTQWRMNHIALRDDANASKQQRFEELAAHEAQARFELTREGPMRATLVTLDPQEQRLLWTLHHSVCDGWSVGVLIDELCQLYGALSQGRAAELPEPELQYADFAAWERQWLDNGVRESEMAYWMQHLKGVPAAIELPTDRQRPVVQRFHGARVPIVFSTARLGALRALAKRTRTSLFMVVAAAWQALMHRYSAQSTVVTGTVVANRDRRELERVVGYLANTLALRTDFDCALTVAGLLAQVKATALSAYEHQHLPFEEIVEALKLPRDTSRMPLIQTMVVLQAADQGERACGSLRIERDTLPSPGAKLDLTLELREQNETLRGCIEYDSDLFDPITMERMVVHLTLLADAMCADESRPVLELPMLDEAERSGLITGWNDTRQAFDEQLHVQRAFEQQVRRTPDAVALTFDDGHLSYGELNAQANRLAHHLRGQGVGPDVIVAVCLERSLQLVLALMAVLKAGGAFLALDPDLPAERLAFQLDDTGAPIVLTHSRLLARLPHGAAQHIVCCDLLQHNLASSDDHNPECRTRPEHLAYVIYTSGSTGQPKGVLLPHAGLANHGQWLQYQLRPTAADRVLQLTSISFDASLVELFMPLCCGASVVLLPAGEQRDSAAVARQLLDRGITILQMVPSALRALLDEPGFMPGRLRYVISGGEALDLSLAQQLQQRLPHAKIGNFYGPTENSIDATHCEWPIEMGASQTVPIGRPIANVQCYVLDAQMQPVPAGVVGELYIGGRGLARGYLNRPDLTAQRFVPNPFANGQRLYRSGDMVRLRGDGNIEFCGRADSQVKMRGYRIELGEIEAALAAQPRVRHCAVMVREEAQGLKRLVAYVVGADIEVVAIKRSLTTLLPEYMVPSQFVLLEAMPSLPNGKIDRKALPTPRHFDSAASAIAPRNAREQAVWDIWRAVLKIERFGVYDNFFELGGHSLVAMQVVAKVRAAFQLELPLRDLFDAPTVAALADRVAQFCVEASGEFGPITARGDAAPVPLSAVQKSMWLAQRLGDDPVAYHIGWALRLAGPLNDSALRASLQALVQRHDSLRIRIVEADGTPRQVLCESVILPFKLHDLAAVRAEDRSGALLSLLRDERKFPFDLTAAPLARAVLVKLSENEHVLQIVQHHLVSDGWSEAVVRNDLAALYAAHCDGSAAPRAPGGPGLLDYVAWDHARAATGKLEPQLRYWKQRLAHVEPLNLPLDASGLVAQGGASASCRFTLPRAVVLRLNELAKRRGATMYMLYLAAFKLLLMRWCGQDDIAVGTPIACRDRPELANVVGPLLNTVVLRTSLAGNPTFGETLDRVRLTTLEGYQHQDQPFDDLVAAINPVRGAGRNPLFDILVNSVGGWTDPPPLKGLECTRLDGFDQAAKFALTLYIDSKDETASFTLNYRTDLLRPCVVSDMAEQFGHLLAQIASKPDARIAAYSLVTDKARAVLPQPALSLGTARAARVHEQFVECATRSPRPIAVLSSDGQLSYGELEEVSRGMAQWLHARGVTPGERVAIVADRRLALVAAVLGCARAGAVFTILDGAYPEARIADCLSQIKPRLVLECRDEPPLAADSTTPRARIEFASASLLAQFPVSAAELPQVDASGPAYITFTSGTSGRPKGIVTGHAALPHFVQWHVEQHGLTADDRFSLLSGLSHDPLLRDIFTPLAIGATLCVPEQALLLEPARIAAWLAREKVSIAHLTPALGQVIATGAQASGPLTSLRRVFWGGESLSRATIRRMVATAPNVTQVNFYGTSETPQAMACHNVAAGGDEPTIPIGRGIDATQLLLLSESGTLSGLGHPSEIFIRTPYLSQGYLDDPDLTRSKFIRNPYSNDPTDLCYRTGDLGRYRDDGSVEYLGRIDNQVKIRGFRVELAEIERLVETLPGVDRAIVKPALDAASETSLLLYYAARGAAPVSQDEVWGCVRQALPPYMWPRHVVRVESFPVLPGGKVDLRALPAPEDASRHVAAAAPRTPMERAIAEVWQALLGLSQVSLRDNFFELGGHSLLAMRAVHEIEKRTGVTLSMRRLVYESLGQLSVPDTGSSVAVAVPAKAPAILPVKTGKLGRLMRALADLYRA